MLNNISIKRIINGETHVAAYVAARGETRRRNTGSMYHRHEISK